MANLTIAREIQRKLEVARIARLATVDANGRPHVIPVCFIWDGSFIYSAIDDKPKRVAANQLARVKNIQTTPHVSLVVDHYDEDWTRLWYILVCGEAELVTIQSERRQAIQRLRTKYPQYDTGMLSDEAPVVRITPARVVGWGKI
jgi:PPOX class probable F420-dependent enzyme